VKKEGSGEKKEEREGGRACEYDSTLVIKHIKVDLSEVV